MGYDRPDMTICAKCGTENAAGDAFCGSCGAFLAFAAEEAAEAEAAQAEAETTQAGAIEADVGGARAGVPPSSQATVATPSSGPPDEAGGAAAPPGPTCSACGRANPAGRRFCISCGERLPSATAAVAPAPAATESAAPPAGPPGPPPAPGRTKPAWEFPAAPVATARAAATPEASAATAPATGGRSKLPLIGGAIVILALVGSAVLVLGGGLGSGTAAPTESAASPGALASPGAGGAATSEPSAAVETSAADTAAPSEAPSLSPVTPEPTVAPATIPTGSPVGIAITAAKASSQLAANRSPKLLHDGSPVTAWKSKTGKLDGSWVEVTFPATAVTKIQVWAGWQRDEPLFYGNHRPHNVTVAFDGGLPVPLALEDALGAQGVAIPPELGVVGATRLRITIIDTYPSRKTSAGGSPSKEVAISEIRVFGIPAAP